jgi:hypothetical protein
MNVASLLNSKSRTQMPEYSSVNLTEVFDLSKTTMSSMNQRSCLNHTQNPAKVNSNEKSILGAIFSFQSVDH